MNSTTKLILIIFIVLFSLAGLGLSIYSLLEPCKNEPFSSPSPCSNPLPISINCSNWSIYNTKDYIANENKIINVKPWMITYDGYIEQKMSSDPLHLPLVNLIPPLLKCNNDDCQGSSLDICAKLNKYAFTKDVLDSLQKFMCEHPSNSIVPKDYTDFTKGWKVASI